MAPSDPKEAAVPDRLELAQTRLDEACARLAARLDDLASAARGVRGADIERPYNAADEALAQAAGEASHALAEAIAELQALRGDRS
ncbi:MAG: hypothetical protein NXI12_07445 [Alphaproteobacteria bacterium]|nr:hypothetical protein [Alphaproteobacteria bacterium]